MFLLFLIPLALLAFALSFAVIGSVRLVTTWTAGYAAQCSLYDAEHGQRS